MNIKTYNVLIIAPYYPTLTNEVHGKYFKDQKNLLKDFYNFKVITSKPKNISLLKYFIKRKILKNLSVEKFELYPSDDGIGFYHWKISIPDIFLQFKMIDWKLSEINHNIHKSAFFECYDELNKCGFETDLVHAHCSNYSGFIALELANKEKIPLLVTEHDYFSLGWHSDFVKTCIKNVLENANNVLAVSSFQRRQILLNGINCKPTLVGNLVNDDIYFNSKKKNSLHGQFTIITYTYISWKNDILTLLSVARELLHFQNFKFVFVVGVFDENQSKEKFEELIEQNDLLGKVEIYYNISSEQFSELLHNSNLYISTHLVETFGIAPCEALACGLPILTGDNGGSFEYINSSNGIIVESRNVDEYVKAVLYIKDNYHLYDSSKISEGIINKFGKKAFSQILHAQYDTLFN